RSRRSPPGWGGARRSSCRRGRARSLRSSVTDRFRTHDRAAPVENAVWRTRRTPESGADPRGIRARTARRDDRRPVRASRSIAQHHRAAAGHRARGGEGDVRARNLPFSRLAAQLLDGFDDMIEAVNVRLGQQSAMRVGGQLAGTPQRPALGIVPRLARLAEPESLERHHDAVREAVVDLRDVDVAWSHAGAAPEIFGNVPAEVLGEIGPAYRVEQVLALVRPAAVSAAHDVDRWLAQVLRTLGGSDEGRARAVALEADVVEPERIDDGARAEVLVERERLAHHRALVGER